MPWETGRGTRLAGALRNLFDVDYRCYALGQRDQPEDWRKMLDDLEAAGDALLKSLVFDLANALEMADSGETAPAKDIEAHLIILGPTEKTQHLVRVISRTTQEFPHREHLLAEVPFLPAKQALTGPLPKGETCWNMPNVEHWVQNSNEYEFQVRFNGSPTLKERYGSVLLIQLVKQKEAHWPYRQPGEPIALVCFDCPRADSWKAGDQSLLTAVSSPYVVTLTQLVRAYGLASNMNEAKGGRAFPNGGLPRIEKVA